MAQNNYKIPMYFNRDKYKVWEEEILENAEPGKIEAHISEQIAVNSILGFEFCEDGYNKKFFDLLCKAQEISLAQKESFEFELYRTNEDFVESQGTARPRLFRDIPTEDKEGFRFIWPITYCAYDENQETKATFYLGIPHRYLRTQVDYSSCSQNAEVSRKAQVKENADCGALCAILFLIASDAIGSFKICIDRESISWVEFPCLLEYFAKSHKNNQNGLSSLIGEYFALLQASFHLNFDATCYYEPTLETSDFKVTVTRDNLAIRAFSVKTNNRDGTLRFFDTDITDPSSKKQDNKKDNKKVRKVTSDAILILNCICNDCTLKPTVELNDRKKANACNENCPRLHAAEIIEEIYGSTNSCNHYVTSARNFFDLRFAMFCFDQLAHNKCGSLVSKEDPRSRSQGTSAHRKQGDQQKKEGKKQFKTQKEGYCELFLRQSTIGKVASPPVNGELPSNENKCLVYSAAMQCTVQTPQ